MSGWSDAADKAATARMRAESTACARDHQPRWRVYQRYGNASAFSGYHWTPSELLGADVPDMRAALADQGRLCREHA